MRKKIDSFLFLSMLAKIKTELKMNLFSCSLACTFVIKCIKQSLKPLKESNSSYWTHAVTPNFRLSLTICPLLLNV